MTPLQKAEQLVREHPSNSELMELSFGCEVEIDRGEDRVLIQVNYDKLVKKREATDDWKVAKILGKPAQLQHYLRVLDAPGDTRYESTVLKGDELEISMPTGEAIHFVDEENDTPGTNYEWATVRFSLTTGRPATEKDAEEYIRLIENV